MTRIILPTIFLCVPPYLCLGQDCAQPGHHDIDFIVQSSKLVTGLAFLDCPVDAPPDQCVARDDFGWRVHARSFLESPCDPYFLDDPGMFAQAGSGLPPGSFLGFDILSDLLYWNGTGNVQFGPVPNSETVKIKLGGQSRTAGTGNGFISGFFFAVIDSQGGVHVHLSFFLQGADGNAVPAESVPSCGIAGDGVQPSIGLYLVKLQFKNNGGATNSDPVWIAFNNGVDSCMDCCGINYVGSQIAHDRPGADLDFDRRVDADDFVRFQACATGPNIPWIDPCCQDADLDHDGDVDQIDFGLFQRCFFGSSMPPDPLCTASPTNFLSNSKWPR